MGSELFINPLMSLYCCFQLDHVAQRIGYLHGLKDIEGYSSLTAHIRAYQSSQANPRPPRTLPM